MYFVYVLYCPVTGLTYVGQTDHLILRYYRHRDGKSRWTRRMRQPVMVHWESFPTRAEAMKREKYYKQGNGARKKRSIIERFRNDSAKGSATAQDGPRGRGPAAAG